MVSIRPRPGGQGETDHRQVEFFPIRPSVCQVRLVFQSAPGLVARGNAVRQPVTTPTSVSVSIRPRPDGQGKLPMFGSSHDAYSFNPPPARWPGET